MTLRVRSAIIWFLWSCFVARHEYARDGILTPSGLSSTSTSDALENNSELAGLVKPSACSFTDAPEVNKAERVEPERLMPL